jgi:hypothetical protein
MPVKVLVHRLDRLPRNAIGKLMRQDARCVISERNP